MGVDEKVYLWLELCSSRKRDGKVVELFEFLVISRGAAVDPQMTKSAETRNAEVKLST